MRVSRNRQVQQNLTTHSSLSDHLPLPTDLLPTSSTNPPLLRLDPLVVAVGIPISAVYGLLHYPNLYACLVGDDRLQLDEQQHAQANDYSDGQTHA